MANGVANKFGINLNAGMDADANRAGGARPLAQALKEMGARRLRFPGGEKSNFYVWASAPYSSAASAHWVPGSYYAGVSQNTQNVDQFMTMCSEAGAQAHINVAYNPAAGLDEQVAAAWVRYANLTKGYAIKYWEVGNEMWNGKGLSAEQAGAIAARYAAAMKAVDPSIKVGISWNNQWGYQTILQAAPNIDFVTCSNYSTSRYASYSTYANTPNVDLLEDARKAVNAVGSSGKTVVVSEFNAINWYEGWGKTNDLGHALVNFETIGQLMTAPTIDYGALWNTRWFEQGQNSVSLYTALDNSNGLQASGMALAVWGRFIKDQLVRSSSSPTVKTYAAYDARTGQLNLFLENKSEQNQRVTVPITSPNTYTSGAVWQLRGTSPGDPSPTWSATGSVALAGNTLANLELPAVSVTVVSLSSAGASPLPAPAPVPTPSLNRVSNGGFEDGSLAPWSSWLNGGQTGLSNATRRAGSAAAWAGGGMAYLYQVVQGLTPNTTYTLTSDVAVHTTSGASAWVGVKNTGGTSPSQEVFETNGSWRPTSLTFTTGSSQTTAEIYLWNSDPTTWAWIDEVHLYETANSSQSASNAASLRSAEANPLASTAPQIYPNPFHSTLQVELRDSQTVANVQLLDARGAAIQGIKVQKDGQRGQVFAPATLPAGLYLLRLTTKEGKTTVHKVVKQ
ncbi:T9SS type A sorting domain-containing protein [Hymenobacter humi]|uniref:T9SS type A sorting domain-containing protein n=1 Tax=Hymenobacter humi TaxID=1411620 RepID=A0ABW2UC48_9BACT